MTVGSDCLFCINNVLVLGKVRYIDGDTVVASLYGDKTRMPAILTKDDVISSITPEAFEAIKEHHQAWVKSDL